MWYWAETPVNILPSLRGCKCKFPTFFKKNNQKIKIQTFIAIIGFQTFIAIIWYSMKNEKCIHLSTNMPSIGTVVLEMAPWIWHWWIQDFLKDGAPILRTDRTSAPVGTGGVWGGCAPSEAEKNFNFQSQFARFGAFFLSGGRHPQKVRCPISAQNRGGVR